MKNLDHRLLDALIVIAGLFLFLVLLSWAQQKDYDDAVQYQKEQAQRYSHMLAQCMNGKMLYDKTSDKLYACDRVIEISLSR